MVDFPSSLNVDAVGNIQLPNASQLLQYLPPEITNLGTNTINAMQGAMSKIQQAQPAINLVTKIANNNAPDPQEVVGALAATAAIANPVAGAIVGAAGEIAIGVEKLAESVLDGLGLISHPPPTFTYVGFVKKNGQLIIPHPWEPTWKSYDYWMTPSRQGWRWGGLPFSGETTRRERTFLNLLSILGYYGKTKPPYNGPVPQNNFEKFFFEMLKKNLENWMNANPSMTPRDLLHGAVSIWNHLHVPSGNDRTYSAYNLPQDPSAINISSGVNPIDYILNFAGDASSAAINNNAYSNDEFGQGQITVNLGGTVVPVTPKKVSTLNIQYPVPSHLTAAIATNAQNSNLPPLPSNADDPCVLNDYMIKIGQQNSDQGKRIAALCVNEKAAKNPPVTPNQVAAQVYKKASVQGVTPELAARYAQTAATLKAKALSTKKDKSGILGAAGATAGFAMFNVPGALVGAGIGYLLGKIF
jgi:hypothetical protein